MHKQVNPNGKPLINSLNGEEASLARVRFGHLGKNGKQLYNQYTAVCSCWMATRGCTRAISICGKSPVRDLNSKVLAHGVRLWAA